MKITVKQLKQLIREQVEEAFGVQGEDLINAADTAHDALQNLLDKMLERKESLARNGDGDRNLNRAISQVEALLTEFDNVDYVQRRESTGTSFSGERIEVPIKRRRRWTNSPLYNSPLYKLDAAHSERRFSFLETVQKKEDLRVISYLKKTKLF